ncbi:MAG TPA: type VII secretion-associated serine protease mycosin [Mycobacterium sp.]|uniref:type VII secretion-associated serine protease mycosin n=1 Tax=Mycobacterium sp. TaxID=1785 RepID=UPI002D6172D9|nr:type VII secretion-associated serine protease mycosin [Mycobacterium sp.]HZU46046.1 type VII secretion-associated serine protease mycosin [Mycobacterium sp.]
MTTRGARIAALVALIALYAAPPAHAVSPPPIDDSRLPGSATPAPPQPTVQRELCSVPTAEPAMGDVAKSAQLAGLDLPRVWELTRGSGQRVAIIDTGVSPHQRLPDVVAGGDYVSTGDGTQDCDGHGTIVAGIIAARSDPKAADHFSGIAPEATVISIRQSSTKFGPVGNGSSTGVGDVDTMAKAVRTAADLGASVINISTVACIPAESSFDDRSLGAALAYAVDVKNAVVVAAAGNTGGAGRCPAQAPQPTWDTVTVAVSPAWYDDYVLTVGSVNAQGAPSTFSIPGPWVDVAAPGEAVTSLSPVGDGIVNSIAGQGGPAPLSGTSYAAPVVSGLATLIRSRFPTLTARQVMQRIEATAHRPPGGWNPVVGNGVIDALAAVSTDAPPTTTTRRPPENPVAIPAPAPPPRPSRAARHIAFTGAAICVVVLAAAVSTGTAAARLRRSRTPPATCGHDDIACD